VWFGCACAIPSNPGRRRAVISTDRATAGRWSIVDRVGDASGRYGGDCEGGDGHGETSEEARQEAQRLIEDAREEAERIRSEARGDAPELQRATEQLRVEQRRALHDVEELRDQLSSLLGALEAGSHASVG
jgi:hypothetical protein